MTPATAPATASAVEPAVEPVVEQAQLDLLPRPTPPPEVLAAITAAAELLWTRPAAPEEPKPDHDAWRFSGRWWAQPVAIRRSRPWARP